MGQGQEIRADNTILKLSQDGGWVFLQNVHLMQTWLPTLEETLETLNPHPNFRVFISAEPPPLYYIKNIPEGTRTFSDLSFSHPYSVVRSSSILYLCRERATI
jgi:dynein heavy chain